MGSPLWPLQQPFQQSPLLPATPPLPKADSAPVLLRPLSRAASQRRLWDYDAAVLGLNSCTQLWRSDKGDTESAAQSCINDLVTRQSAARLETPTGREAANLRWGLAEGPVSLTAPLRKQRGRTVRAGRRPRRVSAPQQELQKLQERMERSHQNLCLADPDSMAARLAVAGQGKANACKEEAEMMSTVQATIRRAAGPKEKKSPAGSAVSFLASEGSGFVGRFRQFRELRASASGLDGCGGED